MSIKFLLTFVSNSCFCSGVSVPSVSFNQVNCRGERNPNARNALHSWGATVGPVVVLVLEFFASVLCYFGTCHSNVGFQCVNAFILWLFVLVDWVLFNVLHRLLLYRSGFVFES